MMKHKKKFSWWVLLAVVLTLSLAACGSTKTSRMPADLHEREGDWDGDWDGDGFTGEEYVGAEDFIGEWKDIESQRAIMSIEETDEPGVYDVVIHWGGSYNTAMQWRMEAFAENDMLYYEDGEKVEVTFPDDGVEQETVIWDDGSGYFWFDDDGYLRWYDEQEETAEDRLFVEEEYEEEEYEEEEYEEEE